MIQTAPKNGNYYPQTDGLVNHEVSLAIRTAYEKIYRLEARLKTQEGGDYVSRSDAIRYLGPYAQRTNLQAGGIAPINVEGLLGQLAQPQIADAVSVTALPSVNSPLSQDGVLVSLNDQVYRFDGRTDPGVWYPITAATTFTMYDNEVPAGAINGVNKVFTLPVAPNPANSLHYYWNGLRQISGTDYVLAGLTVTMTLAPVFGDNLLSDFRA